MNREVKSWLGAFAIATGVIILAFLGDRYVPASDDPKGHAVWAKNVYWLLNHKCL